MERKMIVRVADGADLCHHGDAAERFISPDDKGWAPSSLFMARLRIEVDPNDIAGFWLIRHQSISLPTIPSASISVG
jgi:hypothetical protein